MFNPRPAQQAILSYTAGTMGIAAVPGSGKTWTLSRLAASLIQDDRLADGQEVLVVTLVNSAVDNFRKRIAGFLHDEGLIPGIGYHVCTLHSLAFDLVLEAPTTLGLPETFSVVDDRTAESILRDAFRTSYPRYAASLADYLPADAGSRQRMMLDKHLPELLEQVMRNAISHLKNRRITHRDLRGMLGDQHHALVGLAAEVYGRYQQGLMARSGVDFDDLIVFALEVLDHPSSEALIERLRRQWPFILEDEAQDSSNLQEQILRRLVGATGNWVRVGDPNQAIYETFTTANPKYLRDFLVEADAQRALPNSGRSARPILALANELIRWTMHEAPVPAVRDALGPPRIEPTPEGDPQPNPPDAECRIVFHYEGETPEVELDRVVRSLKRWLPENPDKTVAVLAPTHRQGAEVIHALALAGIPFTDALLRLTTSTREAAGALCRVLQHLAHPASAKLLPLVYKVWFARVKRDEASDETSRRLEEHAAILAECSEVEAFFWPRPGADWLAGVQDADAVAYFHSFRTQLRAWHRLALLPIGELLTGLAQDLFVEPEKLAMTQLFGDELSRKAEFHLGVEQRLDTLDAFQRELEVIAKDQRRLRAIEADKGGFDPDAYRGQVAVATMHGAKGLEWDRVYLLSVNEFYFPAGLDTDAFQSEKWFVRDKLNLEAEALAQLDAAIDGSPYHEGDASRLSRYEYARERLRLLYVGITRARRELIVTANNGKGKNRPAAAFDALKRYLDTHG